MTLEDTVGTLREFHRTLNEEGLLVLTFDYPTVNLNLMNDLLLQAGFQYWGRRILSCLQMLCPQICGVGYNASGLF